ncbi:MAG: hypothetical protein ABI210_11615 [Abditibacteriaceae bacterium]
MSKSLTQNSTAQTDENAELQNAVHEFIAELESANKRMAERRVRIDRLAAETRVILDDIKAISHVA